MVFNDARKEKIKLAEALYFQNKFEQDAKRVIKPEEMLLQQITL